MKYAEISKLFKTRHEVLTIREVAQTLRCSETHVRRMIHGDELPCFPIGNQYRVLKSDVLARLKKGSLIHTGTAGKNG